MNSAAYVCFVTYGTCNSPCLNAIPCFVDSLAQIIIYCALVAEDTTARCAGRGSGRAVNTMDREVVSNTHILRDSKSFCTVDNYFIENIFATPSFCNHLSKNEKIPVGIAIVSLQLGGSIVSSS